MRSLALVCALLMIWPFSSGQTFRLVASQAVPAAAGTVKVEVGSNGNTKLDIKVRHLAQPSSLTPPKAVYLAWIRPNAQAAQKLGAIQLDSNLSGELKTTTTVRDGEVLITPEQSVNASAPSLPAVLQAHVNAK